MGSDSPRNRVFTPPRGKWKREKNLSFCLTTPYSTVFQGRRSEEEFTSTAGSDQGRRSEENVNHLHCGRWDLPHFHFQQFCIQLIQQSGPADVNGSTPAHGQINHGKGAMRQDRMSHAFVPLCIAPADELLRSPWSSQVDARSSTTKLSGPGPNTGYALAPLWCRPECYR